MNILKYFGLDGMYKKVRHVIMPTEKTTLKTTLPGRPSAGFNQGTHAVNNRPIVPPFPSGTEVALFGLGCFWGAEKVFWVMPGVHVTAVGYAGGFTPYPAYEEVCSGLTGHNEVVQVVFTPEILPYEQLLKVFFEAHDPTQGMRQGNDIGTQYRSGIYVANDSQERVAVDALNRYQTALSLSGYSAVTTEILPAPEFYFAEPYHQQYLAKNPGGYCGLGGTGVNLCTSSEISASLLGEGAKQHHR